MIVCAVDVTIECDESTDPSNTGFATATDICDGDPVITYSDSIAAGICPDNFIIIRTWIASNTCNLSDTCIQLIAVIDTTAPAIICPADVTIECDESPLPGNTGLPVVTDNCDASPSVLPFDILFPSKGCSRE